MKYYYFIFLFSLYACNEKKTIESNFIPFDTQGHRGCRGLMPENTIPAMIKAIDIGVRTLEMDVVISADGKVVVSHDPYFNHEITTQPNGDTINVSDEKNYNLYRMTYDKIKLFDVGIKIHPRFQQQSKIAVSKPLLEDLIDSVSEHIAINKKPQTFYNIETKCTPATDDIFHPTPEVFSELLMKVIMNKQIANITTIQSFDIRTLIYIHKHYPKQKTSLLIDEGDSTTLDSQIKQLGFIPSIYSPHFSLVTKELIKQCHNMKIQIIPWTVNDFIKMQELKLMGVDGLISDYPDLYSKL
jgi:glycerophosphoryl diester phosphodiesterase